MSRELEVIQCPECWTELKHTGIASYTGYTFWLCPECNKEVVIQDDY